MDVLQNSERLTKRELVALEMMKVLVVAVQTDAHANRLVSICFSYADDFIARGDKSQRDKMQAQSDCINAK
jgi:hypothetical protein